MTEQRQHQRAPIDVPVEYETKGSTERVPGRARDLSVGGMFIETARTLPFASEVVIHVTLPGQRAPMRLPAVVRWTRAGGMGVQFGLLGARDTHALTEVAKASAKPR
jgi:PilZ domain